MSDEEILQERYDLAMDRIRRIPCEHFQNNRCTGDNERVGDGYFDDSRLSGSDRLESYFVFCAEFLIMIDDTLTFLETGGLMKASLEELGLRNQALYADILPEHYEESYGNPVYAVRELGEELGAVLSFLYAELRCMIGFAYEGRMEELVIRMELFLEIYTAFVYAAGQKEEMPSRKDISEIIYWFASDYAELAAERRLGEQLNGEEGFAIGIIKESDLLDLRFLYGYGEYVSERELKTARFLAELPEKELIAMADDYRESCHKRLEAAGEDFGKKGLVALGYRIGYERMLGRAVSDFEKMGLRPVAFRATCSILDDWEAGRRDKGGFYGSIPNRQFDYDHKEDKAIFLDKNYVNRRLEGDRAAYEKWKTQMRCCVWPAVVEDFEETDFQPVPCREALRFSRGQEHLLREYAIKAETLRQEYISEEEK